MAACAAFSTESRMKLINDTEARRQSEGHPSVGEKGKN